MAKAKLIVVMSKAAARRIARRNRLVEAHTHLVPPIAKAIVQKLPPSFEVDDLIQAGMIGLMDAAAKYAPHAHNRTPFDAYARHRIRGAIEDSIRRRNYTDATGLELEAAPEPTYSDPVQEFIDRARRARAVHSSLEDLAPRQRRVIELHYVRELKLAEVGAALGVCPSRASQLHVQALRKLKSSIPLRPHKEAA